MCPSGMERDRSGLVENTVPYENFEIQTGIIGRIERSL